MSAVGTRSGPKCPLAGAQHAGLLCLLRVVEQCVSLASGAAQSSKEFGLNTPEARSRRPRPELCRQQPAQQSARARAPQEARAPPRWCVIATGRVPALPPALPPLPPPALHCQALLALFDCSHLTLCQSPSKHSCLTQLRSNGMPHRALLQGDLPLQMCKTAALAAELLVLALQPASC